MPAPETQTGRRDRLLIHVETKMRFNAIFTTLLLAFLSGAAAHAQTDAALSFYGAFSGGTTASGVVQSPANSAGGIVEVRHIHNPIVGYEATYSFNRANQTYTPTVTCGLPCGSITATTVKADAHEITADWVASVKVASFRPFALAGVGALVNVPTGGQNNTTTSTMAVYIYGAGIDWGLLPHLGLRFQYRGNLYERPDLTTLYTSAHAFTHTAEPMIGVYFRL
jgi:opacity protein-like surface antigen